MTINQEKHYLPCQTAHPHCLLLFCFGDEGTSPLMGGIQQEIASGV